MDLKTVFLRFRIKEEEWSREILVLTLTQPWVTSLEKKKATKMKMGEGGKNGSRVAEEEDGKSDFPSFLFLSFVFSFLHFSLFPFYILFFSFSFLLVFLSFSLQANIYKYNKYNLTNISKSRYLLNYRFTRNALNSP